MDFKIAEAYVLFTSKGLDQVQTDVEHVQAEVDKFNRHAAMKKARQRQSPATAGKPAAPESQRQSPKSSAGASGAQQQQKTQQATAGASGATGQLTAQHLQKMFGRDAYSRFQQQKQSNVERMGRAESKVEKSNALEQSKADRQREAREKEAAKDNEKLMGRMSQIRKRQLSQVDSYRKAEERADRNLEIEQKQTARARRMKLLAAGALTKTAFGSVPFVGGAADIAMAGAVGGPIGAGAMAVGKGLQYGAQGAAMASPATMERLNYQMERMQAGIGSAMIPAIQGFTRGLEKASNWLFGKGFQLSKPQVTQGMDAFSQMRDRLQMQALREATPTKGSRFDQFTDSFGDVLRMFTGKSLEQSQKERAERERGKMDVFD